MLQALLRRALEGAVVVALTSLLVFAGIYLLGNPVHVFASPDAPPEVVQQVVLSLGLDRPWHEQYLRFASRALHGDLGISYVHAQPSLALIFSRLPATLELVLFAMLIAIAVGVPLGLVAGYWPRHWSAQAISSFSVLGISVPAFWIGLMLIIVLALEWRLLPTGGRGATADVFGIETSLLTLDGLHHLVLPGLTLATLPLAVVIRLIRAGVREQRQMDHVRFARALGIAPWTIVRRYILRNVMVPLVTVMGLLFGTLVAFAVVTETVFAWPGSGKLIIDSIRSADRPVVIAYILFVVVMFMVINALVDVITALVDPRVRLQ
jgi:peptide/nickel transport system permease protein